MVNKLISIRLEAETLAKIDQLAEKQSYRTRSLIINNVLKAVIDCSSSSSLARIIDTTFPYEKGFSLTFERNADLCRERAANRSTDY